MGNTDGYGQSVARFAMAWAFTDNRRAHLGYGWIRSPTAVGKDFDEHRISQQLTWRHPLGPFTLVTRTSLGQHLVELGDDIGWRFRQLLGLIWPIPGLERLALVGHEEILLNLNDTDGGAEAGFNQNRTFHGARWRFDSEARVVLEMGYLNFYLQRDPGDDRMDHLLSVTLLTKF
jgi:hypothetical protein